MNKLKKYIIEHKNLIITITILITLLASIYIVSAKKSNNKVTETISTYKNEENVNTFNKEDIIVAVLNSNENNKPAENTQETLEENKNLNTVEETKTNITSDTKYYIKVSYTCNVVAIYTKDENGNYNNLYKTMICSTGTATPRSGVYKMDYKYRWLALFGNVYGQYCSRITGNILFHSVPYLSKSPDTLEYWEYDKLGTTASAGCVRLTVEDALWIYNNCARGTCVEFCQDINVPKPTSIKISQNEECRNYDPTDPVENNPWRTYKEENNEIAQPNVENPIVNPEIENNINEGEDNTLEENVTNEPNNNIESIEEPIDINGIESTTV